MSMTPTTPGKSETGTSAATGIPPTHGTTGDPHDHPIPGDPTAPLDHQAAQTVAHVLTEHLTNATGFLGTVHARAEPVDRRDQGRDQDWRVRVTCEIRTPGEWRSFYAMCADVLATGTGGKDVTRGKGEPPTN